MSRIGMIRFDEKWYTPQVEELCEEVSQICWGNVELDEREPYTYEETIDVLREYERKALAFDRFRELLERHADEDIMCMEMLDLLDIVHREVDTVWEVPQ